MRVTVLVRPKVGILDPQGEAISRALRGAGHAVASVRAGKVFELEVDAADPAAARAAAATAAEQILANPLIEEFEVLA